MVNKSFTFQSEDIIVCEFDPVKKQLSFKRHKSNNRFTLSLDIPDGEKVVPCVNLCSKGEKVVIIDHLDLAAEDF